MADEQKRSFFRLEYPAGDRPKISIRKDKYDVIDLSEQGVKFKIAEDFILTEGEKVRGTITFSDGSAIEISGEIKRIASEPQSCALFLQEGVPLPKMMAEQRMILQKYSNDD